MEKSPIWDIYNSIKEIVKIGSEIMKNGKYYLFLMLMLTVKFYMSEPIILQTKIK